ncbi:hypothetical protein [Chitinophaga eiseniae]|uniref:hypothetical protein n=1 Tax=Chitinophaga eiseniae TaxID=634771 RepID=UPI00135667DA|nr:hypothetical protein [Chitinophaga eiseniae]
MKPNTIDANANASVFRHRSYLDTSRPDIWSPKECLLIGDNEPVVKKLIDMCEKRPGNPLPGSRPYTQLIREPGYLPYASAKVPVTATGDDKCPWPAAFGIRLFPGTSSGPSWIRSHRPIRG